MKKLLVIILLAFNFNLFLPVIEAAPLKVGAPAKIHKKHHKHHQHHHHHHHHRK